MSCTNIVCLLEILYVALGICFCYFVPCNNIHGCRLLKNIPSIDQTKQTYEKDLFECNQRTWTKLLLQYSEMDIPNRQAFLAAILLLIFVDKFGSLLHHWWKSCTNEIRLGSCGSVVKVASKPPDIQDAEQDISCPVFRILVGLLKISFWKDCCKKKQRTRKFFKIWLFEKRELFIEITFRMASLYFKICWKQKQTKASLPHKLWWK